MDHRQTQNCDFELENVSQNLVVSVKNVYKDYGNVRILQGLDMSVPKGSVYGLLGSSGCGKSTLLRCIIGIQFPKSGSINVFDQQPSCERLRGRIGYMPQEIGLQNEFTIGETLLFYGRILEMSAIRIKERTRTMIDLLMLPDENTPVKNLSGGQQRRVSLAVALIHEPELIILDEPTVGVDPVLRELIWKHFVDLTRAGDVTIIITTHYLEESSKASTIGLMRGGYLIAEGNPRSLLDKNNERFLEQMYLKLSIDQNLHEPTNAVQSASKSTAASKDYIVLRIRYGNVKVFAWKNILWFRKNFLTLISVIMLPLLVVTLFCLAIGHRPYNFKVAVVNHEKTTDVCNSTLFCHSEELGCCYLGYLAKRGMILMSYENEEDAIKSVRNGSTYASILINRSFSKFIRSQALPWRRVHFNDIRGSEIEVFRDVSKKTMAIFLQEHLYRCYENFFYDYVEVCGIDKRTMKLPLQWSWIYGKMDTEFTNYMFPGLLLSLAFIMGVMVMSFSMYMERTEASLERTFVVGVNLLEIMVSYIIVEFVVLLIQMILTMLCSIFVYGMSANGSLLTATTLLLLSGFSGMCCGIVVSCVTSTQMGLASLCFGVYFVITFTSGLMWMTESVHPYLRPFIPFFPITKSTESLRNILLRGWGLFREEVYVGFLSTTAWSLIFLLISVGYIIIEGY